MTHSPPGRHYAIVISCGVAHADPPPPWADDHYPDINHGNCVGGHGGSYWHQVTGAGMDNMKPHCVVDDGSPQPPPAPHSGCGGNA